MCRQDVNRKTIINFSRIIIMPFREPFSSLLHLSSSLFNRFRPPSRTKQTCTRTRFINSRDKDHPIMNRRTERITNKNMYKTFDAYTLADADVGTASLCATARTMCAIVFLKRWWIKWSVNVYWMNSALVGAVELSRRTKSLAWCLASPANAMRNRQPNHSAHWRL